METKRSTFSSPVLCKELSDSLRFHMPVVLGFLTGGYSSGAVGGLWGGGGGLGAAVLPRVAPLCGVLSILTLRVL